MNKNDELNLDSANDCSDNIVIGGGFNKILLLISICFSILIYQFVFELFQSKLFGCISALLVLAIFIFLYSRNICRIEIHEKKIVFYKSFKVAEIDFIDINKISVYSIPNSLTIYILVSIKDRFFPLMFYFVSLNTSIGNFDVTEEKLKEKLKITS